MSRDHIFPICSLHQSLLQSSSTKMLYWDSGPHSEAVSILLFVLTWGVHLSMSPSPYSSWSPECLVRRLGLDKNTHDVNPAGSMSSHADSRGQMAGRGWPTKGQLLTHSSEVISEGTTHHTSTVIGRDRGEMGQRDCLWGQKPIATSPPERFSFFKT